MANGGGLKINKASLYSAEKSTLAGVRGFERLYTSYGRNKSHPRHHFFLEKEHDELAYTEKLKEKESPHKGGIITLCYLRFLTITTTRMTITPTAPYAMMRLRISDGGGDVVIVSVGSVVVVGSPATTVTITVSVAMLLSRS